MAEPVKQAFQVPEHDYGVQSRACEQVGDDYDDLPKSGGMLPFHRAGVGCPMRCHLSGHELRTRQARTEPSHGGSAVNTDVVEARVLPERRRQSEPSSEGAAAHVHNDGIRWLRAVQELAERRNELLKVSLLVQVGIEQGQFVGGQVATYGIEVGLTAANGFKCLGHVHAEERAASRSGIVEDTVRYVDSPQFFEPFR